MSLDRQYATGLSRDRIEKALVAAGLDLSDLQRADLALLEDFRTMGRIATSQLAELAAIFKPSPRPDPEVFCASIIVNRKSVLS